MYDLFSGIIGCLTIALMFFLACFLIDYDLKQEKKRKDYIKQLDNEHDKSVILDYLNCSKITKDDYKRKKGVNNEDK